MGSRNPNSTIPKTNKVKRSLKRDSKLQNQEIHFQIEPKPNTNTPTNSNVFITTSIELKKRQ